MKEFFRTVAIVTIFSVCEKFLGFLYRIYLSRTIGSEGVGIYQVALSVFALLLTACASGTPITVSRLMTKYKTENAVDKKDKIVSAGIIFSLLVSIPVCLAFFAFKGKLGFLFANEHSAKIFYVVLPGLIFTSVYSVLRGVFWGNKDFLPYSIIELLEEICMILVGIFLISKATNIYDGAFKAGVAVVISYVFSFSVASLIFVIRKNKIVNPKGQLRPLLRSATPITAMRTANSLASSLVSVILPLRLISVGYTKSTALGLFGGAAGQAMPLLSIPTTFIGSFILVLVPEISENFYKKNYSYLKKDIQKAVKFTALFSCVFIPVFAVCGDEIGVLVFNSSECGKFLTVSAFLILFMSLSAITTSILNSIGLENKTLICFIATGSLMLLSVCVLPRLIGIYSLLIGYAFVYVITTIYNLLLIKKHCKIKLVCLKSCASCFALTIPTIIFGVLLRRVLLPFLGTILTFFTSLVCMVGFYFALILVFSIVNINGYVFKNKILTKKRLASRG